MDMISTFNSSKNVSNNCTATASAHYHHHQHHQQQEAMDTMPQVVEPRNMKQARQQAMAGKPKPHPQLDEALRCPRCNSSNTKFCYYNNYSMLQPRYICKTCHRYWTHGGSLRNIPVGGGSRKNKRASPLPLSTSSSSSSSTSKLQQHLLPTSSSAAEPQNFPNVLPTFMSTDFEMIPTRSHLPPLAPLSLSTMAPAPVLDYDAGMMTSSFLDMLGGGFLDHQGNNDLYEPMSSCMETPPSLFGFSAFMQDGVVSDHGGGAAPIDGDGGATHEGGQWPTTQVGENQQQKGASVPDTSRAK